MARNEAMSVLNLSNETIISFSEENLTPAADPESSRHLESPTTIEKSAVQIGGTMFLRSRYGMTLALSGNGRFLATNGMAGMDGNGYTHVGVMENQNGSWKQVGNPIEGFSVAISCDGLTIAVQVYRLLRVYRWNGKAWNQGGKENTFPVREYNGDNFRSVSLSGDGTVVALAWDGNYDTNDPGRMEIYKWNGSWQEMGNFQDHVGHNIFPTTTALSEDGSVVAVCVPYVGSNSDGYIVVYQWDGDGWIQLGNRILGEDSVVFESVDISSRGNILAAAGGYGYVKIFELKNGDWQQLGQTVGNLTADLGIAGTRSISISGDGSVVSVGALRAENSVGQVRLFQFDGTLWQQLVEFPGESSWVFRYVTSVSKDGSTVAFGGRGNGRSGSYPDEDHKFISVYSLDVSTLIAGEKVACFCRKHYLTNAFSLRLPRPMFAFLVGNIPF
eukprot:scaffold13380_cov110-Cylindrotheca_fusiformis.AAC.2